MNRPTHFIIFAGLAQRNGNGNLPIDPFVDQYCSLIITIFIISLFHLSMWHGFTSQDQLTQIHTQIIRNRLLNYLFATFVPFDVLNRKLESYERISMRYMPMKHGRSNKIDAFSTFWIHLEMLSSFQYHHRCPSKKVCSLLLLYLFYLCWNWNG